MTSFSKGKNLTITDLRTVLKKYHVITGNKQYDVM